MLSQLSINIRLMLIRDNIFDFLLVFRRIQHIFDKYTVAACGVGDENVCDCSDELTVLHDGGSRHSLNYSATSLFERRVCDCYDEAFIIGAFPVDL